MENNYEASNERKGFPWPRINPVAGRNACGGLVLARRCYRATCWALAMVHIEAIVLRGNAVRVVNVAGEFSIQELVIK